MRRWRRWVALLALGSNLAHNVQAIGAQTYTPIKSDFRRAVALVEQTRRPDDVVILIMPYLHYTFRYYARGDFASVAVPYTNGGAAPEEVDGEMSRLLANRRGVWLVTSEDWYWDQRGLARAWLDAHGRVTLRQAFMRVEVAYYLLN
jgi:hypothetical protein